MRLRRLALVLLLLLVGLAAAGYAWIAADLPSLNTLPERLNPPSVRITDRHGRLLYEVLPEEGGRHAVVPLESIPLALRQATIATEDSGFYRNPGFDLAGILRALWIDLAASLEQRRIETPAGGSTITQQVARNLLLSPEERGERSLRRKLRELLLAWRLTRSLSKDEILALYLNQTYYGGLAYGVEAAAQTFFGKPVSELDLAESALLAGLPQAPARYNPFTDPEAAQARQRIVLGLMQRAGFIDAEQQALAEREQLVFASTPYPMQAPHFVMMVRAQLDELFTPDELEQGGGLVVRTTLDLDWQGHAERAVQRQLERLRRSEDGLGHNVNSAALVALDPHDGQILALVGSPDYFDAAHGGAINMALAPRQPGSALKPILYAAALDPAQTSAPWTAATMLLDVSTAFQTQDGKAYTPANYDLIEHGPVLVREALASSLNIPAVITLDHVGLERLFELTANLGITTLDDPQSYDLSLALGGGAVRLIELTAAYGAFANGGDRVDPLSVLEVTDLQGETLYTASPPSPRSVLDERLAWLISDILSDDDARRVGFGANSVLRLDRPAAVKTGTTSNFHDNWTVGYTPDLVVGVWVGNTDYQPMREVSGLTGAAPIWHQFVRAVLTGRPPREFVQPEGFLRMEICALSGLLPSRSSPETASGVQRQEALPPTAECPYRRWEWFIDGTQPAQPDIFYRRVPIDVATGLLADAATPLDRIREQVVLDLPPQARPWARAQGLTLLSDLQAAAGVAGDAQPAAPLRLVSPAQGSVYVLTPGFESDAQRVRLEAVGESGLRPVTLWLDGELLATFDRSPYQTWWSLAPGEHQAWAEGTRQDGTRTVSERVSFRVEEGGP
ncbi:MAG TPA: transglycosylase domain-containing protein [Anaerolineales bacterium]|nr:transglycosylase domain-containing protein [Anaerolineales bacterium]